jgi:hypothetical protein
MQRDDLLITLDLEMGTFGDEASDHPSTGQFSNRSPDHQSTD